MILYVHFPDQITGRSIEGVYVASHISEVDRVLRRSPPLDRADADGLPINIEGQARIKQDIVAIAVATHDVGGLDVPMNLSEFPKRLDR